MFLSEHGATSWKGSFLVQPGGRHPALLEADQVSSSSRVPVALAIAGPQSGLGSEGFSPISPLSATQATSRLPQRCPGTASPRAVSLPGLFPAMLEAPQSDSARAAARGLCQQLCHEQRSAGFLGAELGARPLPARERWDSQICGGL